MRYPYAAALAMMTLISTGCSPDPAPADRIAALAASLDGEVGLYAKHLGTGETVTLHPDARFPTASVIKVAVLVEAFRRDDEGSLSLDERVAVPDAAKVGGIEGPSGTYVIAIFTRRVHQSGTGADHAALVTGADLSRAVYDRFNPSGSQEIRRSRGW